MTKLTKHAISVVIRNPKGETLFALRSPNKKSFPLVWSLPSHWIVDGETPEATVARIGTHKLGVELALVRLLNEGCSNRPDFTLFMHDYEAKIINGTPQIASDDYVELTWAKPASFLATLPVKGECTKLYSEYLERTES